MKYFILVFCCFLGYNQLHGQQDSTSLLDDETVAILTLIYQLPPVDTLVKWGHDRSYLLKGRSALIRVKQSELAKIRTDWVDIFSFKGNVGFGNSFIDVNQDNLSQAIVSNVNALRLNIGVGINLSPSYWVERKHEINTRKARVEFEQAMKDELAQSVTEKITTAYVMLEYYKEVFLDANAAYESNCATIKLGEKKFLEGEIDISTYNDLQFKHVKLKMEIEGFKRNMKKSYYDLKRLLSL